MSWTRLDDGASIGPWSQRKHHIPSGSSWRVAWFSDLNPPQPDPLPANPAVVTEAAVAVADEKNMVDSKPSPMSMLLAVMAVIATLGSVSLLSPAVITADVPPAPTGHLLTLHGNAHHIRIVPGNPGPVYEIVDTDGTVIDRVDSLAEANRSIGLSGVTMLADTPLGGFHD